jgi:hypothetical protein
VLASLLFVQRRLAHREHPGNQLLGPCCATLLNIVRRFSTECAPRTASGYSCQAHRACGRAERERALRSVCRPQSPGPTAALLPRQGSTGACGPHLSLTGELVPPRVPQGGLGAIHPQKMVHCWVNAFTAACARNAQHGCGSAHWKTCTPHVRPLWLAPAQVVGSRGSWWLRVVGQQAAHTSQAPQGGSTAAACRDQHGSSGLSALRTNGFRLQPPTIIILLFK